MNGLLLAVPLLPLLAGASAALWGRRFPSAAALAVVAATACSLVALVALHGASARLEAAWFATGNRALAVGLEITGLTWFGAVLVAGIALPVSVYSVGYMREEPDRARFFAELALFVSAMLTLVLATSLVLMFAAWEAIGLASYLLIDFHQGDKVAASAAAKAFLMTRTGDVAFLLAWLLVLSRLGTTDIGTLLEASASGALDAGFVTLVALLFLTAAVGKSAQLPLSIWLPDAMVAPTPVSALLHSATLVAAGVYLLLRLYPLFAAAPLALHVVLAIGMVTAVIGALVATAQMDVKRLLAWSTISQFGEMMLAIGIGAPLAAALHLASHASFKSTLFMAAGAVDKYAGTRDLRAVGGLAGTLPVTAACFVVAGLALAGVQPLFTSSSHDAILGAAMQYGPISATFVVVALFLAGLYIGRAAMALFGGKRHSPQSDRRAVTGSMRTGMLALGAASALGTALVLALPPSLPFGTDVEPQWACVRLP